MGASASVGKDVGTVDDEHLEQFELDDNNTLDMFAREMYVQSPRVEGLVKILSSRTGREAYMKFLKSEYADEQMWFFKAVEDVKGGKAPDDVEFAQDAQRIMKNYLAPENDTKVKVSDELRESLEKVVAGEEDTTPKSMLNKLKAAQEDAIRIMAMGAFPRFLLSNTFNEWKENEAEAEAHAAATSTSSGSKGKSSSGSNGKGSGKADILAAMNQELDRVLDTTTWLTGLLASIESLPVCVSLAAASKGLKGFPLIYVNAAFEKTTGYDREEIIGQNCKFLQVGKKPGHRAEPESIARLSQSLKEAKPVKVAITNFRKDGTPFRNLLAMKPIMDQNGDYAFVLGIQFDIGMKDASAKKMKMIDDLFRVLPETVIANQDQLNPLF